MKIIKLSILVFLFGGGYKGQEFRFRSLTSDDGLPVNEVNCIVQDKKEFMWFGTQDGLCRWDGLNFVVYKAGFKKNRKLSSSQVLSLFQKDNKLFVGTYNGLNIIDLVKDSISIKKISETEKGSNDNIIRVIKKHTDNFLVIGTLSGIALFNIKKNEFTTIHNRFSSEGGIIDVLSLKNESILFSTKNNLWLWKINKNEFIQLKLKNGYLKKNDENFIIRSILHYGQFFYLGTNTKGIIKYDLASDSCISNVNPLNYNHPSLSSNIVKMQIYQGKIIVASTTGLFTYHPISEKIEPIYFRYSDIQSSSNYLLDLFVNDNDIWVGTRKNGILYYVSGIKKFHSSENHALTHDLNNVYALYELPDKNLLVSANNSIYHLDFAKRHRMEIKIKNQSLGDAFTIVKDNDHDYLLGTCGSGVVKYNALSKKAEYLPGSEGLCVNCILNHEKYYILGTIDEGIVILPKEKKYKRQQIVNENLKSVYDLKLDQNVLYVAGESNKLMVLDFNEIIENQQLKILNEYSQNKSDATVEFNAINHILIDSKKRIHLATDNGLFIFHSGTYYAFNSEESGLPDNFLYTLIQDSMGNIWYSTNRGLGYYNPMDFPNLKFNNYNVKSGTVNNEHNFGSSHFSSSGNLYFGGVKGFNFFRSSEILLKNQTGPKVHLIQLYKSGNPVTTDTSFCYLSEIKLNWKQNNFTGEFTAIDYCNPESVRFQYFLDDYDKSWSLPAKNRFISYTELPGGTYTLYVRAINAEGLTTYPPYRLIVRVIPPFWKTNWFIAFVILFVSFSSYGFSALRTRKINKEKKILEEKVQERTRELAEKNRDITSSIEYARRIQRAVLPDDDFLKKEFENTFIFYLPKDIVSGDFYWAAVKNNVKMIAAADCTGHGVPGAFMSLIGNNLLNQIVLEKGIVRPDEILYYLNLEVKKVLKQTEEHSQTNDGMDISLLAWSSDGKYYWAGANRPLIYVNRGVLNKITGDKYPIGGSHFEAERKFKLFEFQPDEKYFFYLFSDGYADQFGGDKMKKFMLSRLNALLLEISNLKLEDQKLRIEQTFMEWKGSLEQVDDVLLIGVKK